MDKAVLIDFQATIVLMPGDGNLVTVSVTAVEDDGASGSIILPS